MIQIHVNPARIEKILFVSQSDIEEDFDFATWRVIRPIVWQIDRRLRRIAEGIRTEMAEREAP